MFHHTPDPSSSNPFAVEGVRPPDAKGFAPGGVEEDPDPEWQPL